MDVDEREERDKRLQQEDHFEQTTKGSAEMDKTKLYSEIISDIDDYIPNRKYSFDKFLSLTSHTETGSQNKKTAVYDNKLKLNNSISYTPLLQLHKTIAGLGGIGKFALILR